MVLDSLIKELQALQKAPTGTPVGPNVHGPNSMFGVPGLERDIISSRMATKGLASAIPAMGGVTEYPLYPYITGYTAPTGSQPEAECADGPIAGNAKTCLQTAQFGTYKFRTRELNISRLGGLVNAGESTDLRFVNDPMVEMMGAFVPNVSRDGVLAYGREVMTRFYDVGVAFQDLLMQQLYVGTGTTNEFPGLDLLIVENHYDAKTGQLCAALASDVRDFGDVNITSAAGAAAIVAELVSMVRIARHNADRMGFNPVQFAFAMKAQAFNEISDVWPCSYMTRRCELNSERSTIFVDAESQLNMRSQMRQGSYLLVDDVAVPVIQDDAIAETDLGELVFSSDIYLLPMTIRGGRPALYWEYFDYSKGTVPAIRDGRSETDFWTDGGHYLWHKQPPLNGCMIWQAETRIRVRLETPQLAGRLQNVAYSVSRHFRDTIPGQQYYLNGGNSSGYSPDTLYNEWSNIPS